MDFMTRGFVAPNGRTIRRTDEERLAKDAHTGA
jgi:hypothetical protein